MDPHTQSGAISLVPLDTQRSSPPSDGAHIVQEQASLAFVKGGKRKRLSKVRFHLTRGYDLANVIRARPAMRATKASGAATVQVSARASICLELALIAPIRTPSAVHYFASKKCTYTDSSGRPVPAPRNGNQERPMGPSLDIPTNHAGDLSPPMPHQDKNDNHAAAPPKRTRSDTSSANTSPQHSPGLDHPKIPSSPLLDPDTTHELVNLFFAHCNPHRLIFHKPSFSAALSHNRLPEYLVLAVCAVAAPLSKSVSARASLARVAGVPFYEEAVSIMFDNAGRLLSEPSLATAQALCLMEMHEVAASHSWTKHYKYFDLALRVLEESLEVHVSDDQVRRPAASPPPDSLDTYIERECTRRCFWLIQCMGWINAIYTYRPMRPRSVEMMATMRLPIDETTFDLAVHWNSATSEFLHVPAPRTRYASHFGHVCRILSIYTNVQNALARNEGPARESVIRDCRRTLDAWAESLPAHLRFSEENLEKQTTMFETSSNTGAWCFCFMHALHPCCWLALEEGEGRLGEPVPWVRDQLGMIFEATGTRAKNTILSACVLWSYSKYHPDDKRLHKWDTDFEKVWGFRVTVVADQWRHVQEKERAQAAVPAAIASSKHRDNVARPGSTAASAGVTTAPVERMSGELGVQFHGDASVDGRLNGSQNARYHRPAFHPEAEQAAQPPHARNQRETAQNLPSLKASGLLEASRWRAPSEAFANTLSISSLPPPLDNDGRIASRHHSPVRPAKGPAATTPTMPVGLDWLGNGS
ncbi:uncharacterized protein FIBRA_04532 [Fibroporia radiculosa]|uniref:Xylanolytic transcriptional activator regulatory domain-containing protein n=1 Tax=Fibroporia radiculosa TaxID=599839 RepID=J4G7J1_9APHY|nr:uncharacterized protein FIBRA_04532 [Fibroporia radiculosa]CCM02433.1 predicted protein [Fibroporia radiculosa]